MGRGSWVVSRGSWVVGLRSPMYITLYIIQLSHEGEVKSGGYIYRDAKRRGIYPPLFTDPEGDSCFSIYQIRWIKKRFLNFFF